MYRLLGIIYRKEINQTFLDQMKELAFPEDSGDSQLDEGYQNVKEYLENTGNDTLNELAVDYARVFLGAGISQGQAAFPYESVYTSKKKIVMQDAWEQVREIYASKGLARGNVTKDVLEDHIALELEYMAFLCEESQSGTEVQKNLEEQKDFLDQHLLNWVSAFCADVEKYADTMFYRGVAKITIAYLKLDSTILDSMLHSDDDETASTSSRYVSTERMDEIIQELKKEYKIYAPKNLGKRGAKNEDLIRYAEIDSIKEIVYDTQSDYSPKEIYYPVSQTMFYFQDGKCEESSINDSKGTIIFARPCDIHAMKRLDTIFLSNGGNADIYYKRLRDKVKIVMIECLEGWENCFCVSMGTNKTDDYNLAVRFEENGLLVEVKDPGMGKYFENEEKKNFTPEYIQANSKKVKLPKIENREQLKAASELNMWKDYDDFCIGCGGCNTVCGSCSCFDTVDVIYNETSRDGERRRVWSSCMLDTYTMTAGGNRCRKTQGSNMRFKVLHKVYDYNLRFGGEEHMCTGCGRCDTHCPKNISYSNAVNRLSGALERLKVKEETTGEEIK